MLITACDQIKWWRETNTVCFYFPYVDSRGFSHGCKREIYENIKTWKDLFEIFIKESGYKYLPSVSNYKDEEEAMKDLIRHYSILFSFSGNFL